MIHLWIPMSGSKIWIYLVLPNVKMLEQISSKVKLGRNKYLMLKFNVTGTLIYIYVILIVPILITQSYLISQIIRSPLTVKFLTVPLWYKQQMTFWTWNSTKFAKKPHFSALNQTKNTHKILRHCPVKYRFFNLRNHQHLYIKVY